MNQIPPNLNAKERVLYKTIMRKGERDAEVRWHYSSMKDIIAKKTTGNNGESSVSFEYVPRAANVDKRFKKNAFVPSSAEVESLKPKPENDKLIIAALEKKIEVLTVIKEKAQKEIEVLVKALEILRKEENKQ